MLNTTQHMTRKISQSAFYALVASVSIVSMLFMVFFIAEPSISHGQIDSNEFYIRQTITDESSFLVQPSNIDMAGDINGVTGGNATGTTYFVVQSNNAAGYYVEISFEDNGTPVTMLGDESGSESIRDYDGDVGGEPSFAFVASSSSQFAYTVTSSTTDDTDGSFLHNGSACNASTNDGLGINCWKEPTVAGFRIVDRDSAAVTGATSTLQFKVHVPNSAIPVPQAETYTATATLSLFVK